jgi:hypothetical protein
MKLTTTNRQSGNVWKATWGGLTVAVKKLNEANLADTEELLKEADIMK